MTLPCPVHVIQSEFWQVFSPCPQIPLLSLFSHNLVFSCIFTSFSIQGENVALLFSWLNCLLCTLYQFFKTFSIRLLSQLSLLSLMSLCLFTYSFSFSSCSGLPVLKNKVHSTVCIGVTFHLHLFWLVKLLFSLEDALAYYPFSFAVK